MRNAKLRGDLALLSEVEREWASIVSTVRGRLLALPSRAAPDLVALSDLRAVEDVLRDHVYDALTEISESGSTGEAESP